MPPVLEIQDLRVEFRVPNGVVHAVNGVSLTQEEEEVFCVVGESGAGKSALALAVMGLLPDNGAVTGGRILFDGVDLVTASAEHLRQLRGKSMSLVFQDAQSALNPVQTIGQQLTEVIITHSNLNRRAAGGVCQEMLRELGVPDPRRMMSAYPFTLSGGQCQRVMLAMALVMRPRLLIADEVTSSVDVTLQAEILERLKELSRDSKSAILLITHDMGVVANMARRVGVMYAGHLVEIADLLPIFQQPRHPYTWSLLQTLPRLDAAGRRLQALRGTPPDLINISEQCPFVPRCPKALSRCREEPTPGLSEMEERHWAACYNPVEYP
ncbi:MAG: ABC transporter ATP-binding protein [Dehalococcoidia bacterium]|nr:ABC transporter ATP-binding protein [Dehalococcoidia bacterium]